MNQRLLTQPSITRLRLLVTLFVMLGVGLLSLPARPALAASITVTTTEDEQTENGLCSLREAIRAANLDQALGGCGAGNGADTITLPAGTYILSTSGQDEDAARTGDLDITQNLTITGAVAATTRIDAGRLDRVLDIHPGATVHLAALTFQNGGSSPLFLTHGGGIRNRGTLTVQTSVVQANLAGTGGAIFNAGTLVLTSSTVSGNYAPSGGGGIFSTAHLDIITSQFSGNRASSGAGAIHNQPGGTLTVLRTTLSNNETTDGPEAAGAIYNGGTATITRSTIRNNLSHEHTGGIVNDGVLTLESSTLSNNQGADTGGMLNRQTLLVQSSTLAGNSDIDFGPGPDVDDDLVNAPASSERPVVQLTLRNTLAGTCEGDLLSGGYNLIRDAQGCTLSGDTTGNRLGVDPRLGPLQENGGPTQTQALLPGSPALDAGNPTTPGSSTSACPTTDQRGVVRPQDGNGDGAARCDIGAVEMQPSQAGWGLTGAYYNNRDFTALVRTRVDATVNFDWGYGSPDPALEDSTFSVRWTGQVIPRSTATYTFSTQNDDGVRLWVNNQLLIDDWHDHGVSEHQGSISLQGGLPVSIRLEYYENHGTAAARLLWSAPAQPKQIIPATQLVPAPGLLGAYYQNLDFTSLALSRQDATVNFDWGYGSPDSAIEDSTFSVRWTGQVLPQASQPYTFYTQNDDGVRLWVNDQLLIDDWHDHALTEHAATISLQAGVPVSIRLDYYEHHGTAAVKLLWSSPSTPKQIIPATHLLPPR